MAEYFKRVQKLTPTKFWINNVTREQAQLAIDHGAVGCTQNPSYTWKMLTNPDECKYAEEKLAEIMAYIDDDDDALTMLQRELVSVIAKVFLPMYKASNGKAGYVSIQGSPFKEDTDSIIRYARFNREAGENIMAKIPATETGLKAIEVLAAERVPINATECMTVRQVLDVCEIYEKATANIENPAPLYFSLITGIFDEYLQNYVREKQIDIDDDILSQAGISIAKKVHALVAERNYPCGFIGGGARKLCHFTDMVGANASITINWNGTADALLKLDLPVTNDFHRPTQYSVEDELIEKIDEYRRAYFIHGIQPEEYEEYGAVVLFRSSFEKAWKQARDLIASKR